MTDIRACVTNDLAKLHPADRPRKCLQRTLDEESGRWVPAHYAGDECPGDGCRGCVPREADHGHLCRGCFAKAADALTRVSDLILHLRSISKNPQAIGERVDTSMEKSIIVPDSWLAADGLLEALGSPAIRATVDFRYQADIAEVFEQTLTAVGEWSNLETVVESREGAKRAVVLVRRMQTALKRWPDSEVDWRRVPLMLCPNCWAPTLHRRAPIEYEDDLLIQCAGSNLMYEQGIGYDQCEFAMDWFEWLETYSKPIEAAFSIHAKNRNQ